MLPVQDFFDKTIKNHEKYKAHIKNGAEKETLCMHTERTFYYFTKIKKDQDIPKILNNIFSSLFGPISEDFLKLLHSLFDVVPLFHDLGKINPAFQKEKMKNDIGQGQLFPGIGSHHSIISSVIYYDHCIKAIKGLQTDKNEKKHLSLIALINSYIISRHHSSLNQLDGFIDELKNGSGQDILNDFVSGNVIDFIPEFFLNKKRLNNGIRHALEIRSKLNDTGTAIYIYARLLYSMLSAADYYAASEYDLGEKVCIKENPVSEKWIEAYEETGRVRSIRDYQKHAYPISDKQLAEVSDINILRNEIFCDAEKTLTGDPDRKMYYLQAPTGSGKSNTAVNLSLQLVKSNPDLHKIIYVYPFNTLVEQNYKSLSEIYDGNGDILKNIAVVNSLTSFSVNETIEEDKRYKLAYLDRQFLNYPMILTTHVSLFDTLFGNGKPSTFGLYQLANSVIILDEIQSYNISIWEKMTIFLKEYAEILNIRFIIMSATLPNLDLFCRNLSPAKHLLPDAAKYFKNKLFSQRVTFSYDMLNENFTREDLILYLQEHIVKNQENKILVEFLKKKTAKAFYHLLCEREDISTDIELMTGDDSSYERKRILKKIQNSKSIILIATQVVEAGVDIDMDIGYKDVSKLDSEEQFCGRINRSFLRKGTVYFFDLDEAKPIYKKETRVNPEFSLSKTEIKECLENKEFDSYYDIVIGKQKTKPDNYTNKFFEEMVAGLDFKNVCEEMSLIDNDYEKVRLFLSGIISFDDGTMLEGEEVWNEYKNILQDNKMDYSKKKYLLSVVSEKMSYFLYEIPKKQEDGPPLYTEVIGDIFYIADPECYFVNGKFDVDKLEGPITL